MEENKTILTDYFNTNDAFFIPIVEEELFFSLHSDDVYTAYLKMRMDKIYQKKKLDEIDGLIPVLTCSDLEKVKAEIKRLVE